ncbi:hypothetical protein B566_EDAN003016 [Ephemera danica]|nr:hypothetical protein B566_EDAN003016 [Ephemera danica]
MALFYNISMAAVIKNVFRAKNINLKLIMSHARTFCDAPKFPGAKTSWTEKLEISHAKPQDNLPVYRVLDREGNVIDSSHEPKLSEEVLKKMYRSMTLLSIMDNILYESQRQGRISFYMTNLGEEAAQIGSIAAMRDDDMVFGQYREAGVLVYRGMALDVFMNQCYGNNKDLGKGKQMPVHYGNKDLNFVTISSPLTTQLPQAVGAAYAFKRIKNNERAVITYFGDGAASEGDFHAALNFAATLECPILFFCRNNGYAISTPTYEQYRGDGIASRGPGYGIGAVRCDGNDVLAVYNTVQLARKYITEHCKPILVEAMTYRVGHHSTSDDSTAYRPKEEIGMWSTTENPIGKFKKYLVTRGLWSDQEEQQWTKEARTQILQSFNKAEKVPKPDWREMFEGVYESLTPDLKSQIEEMESHLKVYGANYPLESFKSS